MITDLVQIRRLGEAARPGNERLRQHMKRRSFHEKRFRRIAEEIEAAIDCRVCANCCRKSTVRLSDRDIQRLSKALRVKEARVIEDYTMPSEDEGLILRRDDQNGCIFLSGQDCTIYEDRPDICRDYPHLVHGPGSLLARMWHMPDRATVCPIVYNTLEAYKTDLGVK
jgi:Fe-S-cluster containining protein